MTCKERALSGDYLEAVTDYDLGKELERRGDTDYCDVEIGRDLRITYISRKELEQAGPQLYTYQAIPKCYGLMQEGGDGAYRGFDPISLIRSGILRVQNPPLELTGRGVIIGFLDTGIRYDNEVFRNTDGTTRILSIWDQTIQSGTVPEGYIFGSEYSREMIDAALKSGNPRETVPSWDENGHGTALASVAAGSKLNYGRTFLGAAPEADIVVVKLREAKEYLKEYYLIPQDALAYSETDILLALKYLSQFGEFMRRPVVVCFGLGTNMGDHSGSATLASYMDELSTGRNCAIVVCGGNEGNAAHHFTGRVCPRENNEYEDVEIRVGDGNLGFMVELWGNIPELFSIQIRSPGGEMLPAVPVGLGANNEYSFVYEKTTITLDFLLVEQGSSSELMVIRFRNPTPGIWTIRVLGRGECIGTDFNLWLPIQDFLYTDTYFLRPTPYTTLTVPSYAEQTITTSTYQDSNNSFWVDSGRGFGRRSSLKPDIAAPGVNISTALGSRTGASMGAAITAGAVAQLMQWAVVERNDLLVSGGNIKNYLILGAERDANIQYPSREWGFGRLNIERVFDVLAGGELGS